MLKSLAEFPTITDIAYRDYLKHSHVSDVMTTSILTISPEAFMDDAVRIMGERHVGSLIVTKGEMPVGIVTERDLLTKVMAAGRDLSQVKVNEVWSTRLITVNPSDTIKEAARTMMKQKGRLVVLKNGRAVGIITASDLIKAPKVPQPSLTVDEVMTKKVEAVDWETPIKEATKMMGQMRIGSVLVNESGKPAGIFTERDLITKVLSRRLSMETKTGELSSRPLITLPTGSTIEKVALTMITKHVRRLPITKDNEIVGIVTARDLVEAYSK